MPTASDQGGGSFQLAPAGAHPARCIHVIDLGTQHDTYMGKPKIQRKVRIGWELVNEKAVFIEEKGEESFMIGQDYTMSLGEKANLRHMLESWRGKPFTADELKGFNLNVLLGKSCLVNVIHKKSIATKRDYAQVTSVVPLPKGMQCAKPSLPKVSYEIEDGENDAFSALPEWIQDKIKASQEFKGENTSEEPRQQSGPEPDEDEIPF